MPLSCIAIDDEPLSLQLVKTYVAQFPDLELKAVFDDALAARQWLSQHPVDLLFIDINMPDITGLELVRGLAHKPMVIFITAHKEFAYDGFELDAIDYLLKPVDRERFGKAVHKAIEYHSFRTGQPTPEPDVIFVRSSYQLVKIKLADIEYLESVEDYVKIHFATGRPVMTLLALKSMLEKLPSQRFIRVHRSYVVSLDKVKSVVNKKVQLTKDQVPVSDSYFPAIKHLQVK
ncbi:two component transcriptional regulator, LytTR family [Cnuella takakiae]|uniref:Two component transcriptional regulator, LytTR family n=1 Tax=Cnuella takakiae TaxID=1302690 RepID=A0A1M5DYX4_9BACT|nr:LytTR family DNA-binding domain-containing protein [Cnuella takakiae]OLY94968.1 DNA-binding response regulator [Cnuella takakiae]SHF72145.1 two component transcriptional regulator, LytTR family [Cnuella takakiae]